LTDNLSTQYQNQYPGYKHNSSDPHVHRHCRHPPNHRNVSLSIGLSTLDMPLNTLVGAWRGSLGFCSTGQILSSRQWFTPTPVLSTSSRNCHCDQNDSSTHPSIDEDIGYGTPSTVGCLVYLDDESAQVTLDDVMVTAFITFNIDGRIILHTPANQSLFIDDEYRYASKMNNLTWKDSSFSDDYEDESPQTTASLLVPSTEELYPTLTLKSHDVDVLCRFCAEDILATQRKEIGAPFGVTVYAVDGSVLFDENNEGVEGTNRI